MNAKATPTATTGSSAMATRNVMADFASFPMNVGVQLQASVTVRMIWPYT